MAEAVGTLVGVISLGFSVCDGLAAYYQAWEARDEEVLSAISTAEQLRKTFELLSCIAKELENTQPCFNKHVADSLCLAEKQLLKLELTLSDCRRKAPVGARDKLVDLSKRATYPFRRKTIRDMQMIVRDLTSNLSLLLQLISL